MKPRVLIVDDEPDFLELVNFKLCREGFEVVQAANGIDALRMAQSEPPDVIVLDVMLPDLDGLSVCEILRRQPATRDVPVVILSALDTSVSRCRGEDLGVSDWLTKGADLTLLSARVRAALEEHLLHLQNRMVETPA